LGQSEQALVARAPDADDVIVEKLVLELESARMIDEPELVIVRDDKIPWVSVDVSP